MSQRPIVRKISPISATNAWKNITVFNFMTIMENATILNQNKIGNVTYYLVNINGNEVYVIIVGAGKVNVASGLMYALVKLCIKRVIVVGNAASLNEEEYPIGSVAIASGSLEWDVNYINLGYPENVVPGNTVSLYPVDSTLFKEALEASNGLGYQTNSGVFASGDTFVASAAQADQIETATNSDFLDVETGVVGQIAYEYNIPYISIKGISNYATETAQADYNTNRETANNLANRVVLNMIESLNEENNLLCNTMNTQRNTNQVYACPCNLRNSWNFFF